MYLLFAVYYGFVSVEGILDQAKEGERQSLPKDGLTGRWGGAGWFEGLIPGGWGVELF